MKLTVNQLRRIIKEEVQKVLSESSYTITSGPHAGETHDKRSGVSVNKNGDLVMITGHGTSDILAHDGEFSVTNSPKPASPRGASNPAVWTITAGPHAGIPYRRRSASVNKNGDLVMITGHGSSEVIARAGDFY